jgi:hypothetical protein
MSARARRITSDLLGEQTGAARCGAVGLDDLDTAEGAKATGHTTTQARTTTTRRLEDHPRHRTKGHA